MAFSRALTVLLLLPCICSGLSQGQDITITGEIICLPVRDSSGPQTLECAIGLRDDDGRYLALRDSDPATRNIARIGPGTRVEVRGLFTKREDPKYQSAGVIEVTAVSPETTPPVGRAFGFSLPDGDSAWVLTVVTSGGFTGQGRGNVSITSQMDLACNSPRRFCQNKLSDDAFRPLAAMISPLLYLKRPDTAPGRFCSDCFTTTVTFHSRERGSVQRLTATWDNSTESNVPTELIRIVEAALALVK